MHGSCNALFVKVERSEPAIAETRRVSGELLGSEYAIETVLALHAEGLPDAAVPLKDLIERMQLERNRVNGFLERLVSAGVCRSLRTGKRSPVAYAVVEGRLEVWNSLYGLCEAMNAPDL